MKPRLYLNSPHSHIMEIEEMSEILSMRLASFRTWPHSTLAERVERNNRTGDRLESGEGVGSDSTPYQMKFNAYWDDKRHGNIRVCGSLSAKPRRRLLWFLPIYIPHVTESFIIRPDGSFVGETEEHETDKTGVDADTAASNQHDFRNDEN